METVDIHDSTHSAAINSTPSNGLPRAQRTSAIVTWYATLVVNPIIGAVGILGNALNCVVLRKCGFNKPSNVFLFGLAIADLCVLVPAVDAVNMLTQFPRKLPFGLNGWEYECEDQILAEFYLIVQMLVFGVSTFGMNVSQCMCVVVTAERLVAVFLPFKFRAIVRPRRALTVVCALYLFWLGATLVYIRKFNFNFRYLSAYQTCVCDYDLNLNEDEVMFDTVCTWIACYVSLAIIIIGSLTIFARVKSASRSRGEITSSKTASCSRTTRTLLAVCGFFGCMQIMRLPYATSSSFPDQETFLIYFVFVRLASNLNSASNFIIYVILNKKFRKILKTMTCCKSKTARQSV